MITVYNMNLALDLSTLGMTRYVIPLRWEAPFTHKLATTLRKQNITFYISTEGGLPIVRVEGDVITPTLW